MTNTAQSEHNLDVSRKAKALVVAATLVVLLSIFLAPQTGLEPTALRALRYAQTFFALFALVSLAIIALLHQADIDHSVPGSSVCTAVPLPGSPCISAVLRC